MIRSHPTSRTITLRHSRTFTLIGAILTCFALGTILASSANARSAHQKAVHATGLQKDLNALATAGAPGAILLIHKGNQTRTLTAGLADVAHKTPMRAGDHFKIASLTKTYTATVVLQLVAAGRLHLADSVEHWLPGLVPNGTGITIRELLNHTSGLPEFDNDPRYLKPYLAGDLSYYWSPRKLVKLAVSHKPRFAPGTSTSSSYSNTNFVVLGLIIEAATGTTIGAELEKRIFRPLHLRNTSYPTRPGLPPPYAHGYLVLGTPPATDVSLINPSMSPASGAIVSTAGDVATFYRALLSGHLLRRDLLEAMKHTIPERGGVDIPGQRYGFGLERFPTSCGAAFGHNGVVPGYTTFVFSTGNGDRQALLMVNDDSTSLPKRAAKLFFHIIDKAYCR